MPPFGAANMLKLERKKSRHDVRGTVTEALAPWVFYIDISGDWIGCG